MEIILNTQNIRFQVDLTTWIAKVRPEIPPHVAEVTSGHEWSPAVFAAINFIDKLERWKEHRYVQADDTNQLLCNMTFSNFQSGHDLDITSNFQHDLFRSNYGSFDTSRREEHDAVKMDVLPLPSHTLRRKMFSKNSYFLAFALEAKPLTLGEI